MTALPEPKGKLIVVGGNEDKGSLSEPSMIQRNNLNFFELAILRRVLAETKGKNSRIEIITTASNIPEEVGEMYIHAFGQLGSANIGVISIRNRDEAQNPEYLERIKKADAVWFTGGNQLKLTTVLGGTDFLNTLIFRYQHEDFLIAGTSAGAAAASNTMIYEGSAAEALIKGQVKITTGLAFIQNVIFDSHFVKRGRFGRLFQAVAANPACIGVGLGEDTGILITEGKHLEAIGSGLVVIVDGRKIKYTNLTDIPEGSPISISNLIVHILSKGNGYNLETFEFLPESIGEKAVN